MMGEGCQIKIDLTVPCFADRLTIKEKLNRNEESPADPFVWKY